ncbi:MAG TPA: DNA methyltransferase [Acidimicrobiales bacterium]|nr:DNA methyltransferase [Acidimicrobiales bacterium]
MTQLATERWLEAAFFDEPEDDSLDGGTTDHGPLWHAISPRWGHSMHTMCSYHGMFPPKLAHYFIERYSQPDEVVLDPFSGRGTTTLQARVEGRNTISNDLNPLAYVLTRAKAAPPTWTSVMGTIDQLERRYRARAQRDVDVPADIEMLFHKNTLRQLVFLRSYLFRRPMSTWSREEFMIAGAVAGILHGAHRSDGSSQYLSISMPNTFSMSPAYVRNFIRENRLIKLDQDVFECLRDKLARLYLDETRGSAGQVSKRDATGLLSNPKAMAAGSVDLIVTSPPYLQVVNYGTQNWIRLWWLGLDEVSRNAGEGRRKLDAKLDHQHNYDAYADFMLRTMKGARRVLKKTGVAVLVIGDVTVPGKPSVALALQVWEDIGDRTGLKQLAVIEDSLPVQNKVSRIWGDTKGKATDRDCALVLARKDGNPITDNPDVDWEEPYKDGGPDAAHDRLRQARRPS